MSVTTLWRAIRANKEDRVAKLEWAPNGGLGRAVIGKVRLLSSNHDTRISSLPAAEHAPHGRLGPPRPTRYGESHGRDAIYPIGS